jgi:hypothetical protein
VREQLLAEKLAQGWEPHSLGSCLGLRLRWLRAQTQSQPLFRLISGEQGIHAQTQELLLNWLEFQWIAFTGEGSLTVEQSWSILRRKACLREGKSRLWLGCQVHGNSDLVVRINQEFFNISKVE